MHLVYDDYCLRCRFFVFHYPEILRFQKLRLGFRHLQPMSVDDSERGPPFLSHVGVVYESEREFSGSSLQSDTLSRACTLCSASKTRNPSRTTIRRPRNSRLSAVFVGEGRVQEYSFNCHDIRCRLSNLPSFTWR